MKIAVASDHAGWKVKEKVKAHLKSLGHKAVDFGTDSETSVDYPDFAAKAARAVKAGKTKCGILICGSGIGMCIVANKIKGIRAANCYNKATAELARRHNDANVLCLGARMLDMKNIKGIINAWLNTPFEGGRHQKRVNKINNMKG